ncbi:MAG: hypothetical protein ACJAZY_000153 [Spirosomataceae bacterium]
MGATVSVIKSMKLNRAKIPTIKKIFLFFIELNLKVFTHKDSYFDAADCTAHFNLTICLYLTELVCTTKKERAI